MAKRRHNRSIRRTGIWFNWGPVLLLFSLLIGLIVLVAASSHTTEIRDLASKCNPASCNQCQNGSMWQITNFTNCPAEPDGDIQLCNGAGRVGLCGGAQYCCPGFGAHWTTDMSACAGNTYSGPCVAPATTTNPTTNPTTTNPPNTDTPTSTPTPVTVGCNSTCNPSTNPPTNCQNGYVCYSSSGIVGSSGSCRNSNCLSDTSCSCAPTDTPVTYYYNTPTTYYYNYNTPTDTPTMTPTPTFYILSACGQTCVDNLDCPGGLVCVTQLTGGKVCRSAFCSGESSCICGNSSTGGNLTVVPSVAEPTPIVSGRTIVLSVSTFTNGKGETNDTPTISGISEPGATIDISILPDGVNGEVIADSAGKWTWRPTKPLTAGKKDLLVVAKLADGQGQVKQSFTVIASAKGGFGWGWIILIMVLVAVGFGAYVYYKSL